MGLYDDFKARYVESNVNGNLVSTTANFLGSLGKDMYQDVRGQLVDIRGDLVDGFNETFLPDSTEFSRVSDLSRAKHQTNINGSFQFKVDDVDLFDKLSGFSFVEGFNSEIGITRRDYNYDALSDSIDKLDFEIPKDIHEFKELNSKLYDDHMTGEPWGPEHAEVIRNLRGTSDVTLTIEGPPYVHTNRSWMDSQGVETEYSGKNLGLLKSLANEAKNERGDGGDITMGDYLYAHMQYVDMEKYDKEHFDHRVETIWDVDLVFPVKGMDLKSTKKEVDTPLVEESKEPSKKHKFPTFDERMNQYDKENPKQNGMSVAPKQEMDVGLEM